MYTELKEKIVKRKILLLVISACISGAMFLLCTTIMDIRQSIVVASLILAVIWWTTECLDKTITSVMLLVSFLVFSGTSATTVFSFALSDSFLLIVLTYLFSRGIIVSGIVDRFLEPLLIRAAKTPFKAICTVVLMLAVTMYVIPQPLARLIIVAEIFSRFLDKTRISKEGKIVLNFSVFFMYIFVNATTLNADIILNTAAVKAAGLTNFTDFQWIKYMGVPSLIYLMIAMGLLLFVFRKELASADLDASHAEVQITEERDRKKDKWILVLIVATFVLWMTEPLHGIKAWIITSGGIIAMFALGLLQLKDWRAIDIPTLVFLTAAISIGSVMKATGVADIVFSMLRDIIPNAGVMGYIIIIMAISICMHMILGSNTTAISIVAPGMIVMCAGVIPAPVVMCIVYISLTTQWLFPFHSVGMMIGVSKGFFPSSYMLRMGLILTGVVFIAVFGLYVPWWKLMGLL